MLFDKFVSEDLPLTASSVPSGYDAMLLATACERAFADSKRPLLHIARDDSRLANLKGAVKFFAPSLDVIDFPAWDCLPYDRVSPQPDIVSKRMAALSRLSVKRLKAPRLVLTTVNAILQRVAPMKAVKEATFHAEPGDTVDMAALTDFLASNGYNRSSQVMEPGEFAVRGGLIDIYPPAYKEPIRLDFFGDELDTIRRFDPLDQRTTGKSKILHLKPASEFSLSEEGITRFRRNYVNTFGPAKGEDLLYEAISEGRKHQGAEHWLPFFHDGMETLFDYIDNPVLSLDHQADEAAGERFTALEDYFGARKEAWEIQQSNKDTSTPPYKPVPVVSLYLSEDEWKSALEEQNVRRLSPFTEPENIDVVDYSAKAGRNFGPERNNKEINVYDAVRDHVVDLRKADKRVVFACYSAGSADRMKTVLEDHDLSPVGIADTWEDIRTANKVGIAVTVLPLETGFETGDLAIISEQDVLGDRLVRKSRKNKRADNFLKEASALNPGDLVVHTSHGIGKFEGLETVQVSGAAHDCLLLSYHGGDKLYVPVENIEILSRFGSEESGGQLDKLGGVAWQARKAKMKERIRLAAEQLIKLAAQREMREGQRIPTPEGIYEEFCSRFPYTETDDQLRAIGDVAADLASGRPMDRLVCGDVGFGKTEVALRAAFLAVMAGHQVAVVAPTTLLARQHFLNFTERFKGLPIRIGQLSRLVSSKNVKATKDEMRNGTIDIVIGTHALLAKGVEFRDLGLLIVDEEQHFGVGHKEKLKELKTNVHVLTLTATPIPRTLQMAMSGIRDLSIIATPPVDRLAVRTFVTPFDQVVIREALLREHYRGGQSFYVCPRISDLEEIAQFLRDYVPEIKFIVAHGQMTPSTMEDVMTAFYEGRYDVLLSTTIIESGIDIPTANTMVVHRADMFGLAQLYQLRGRVGRSKTRAYAYLTTKAGRKLTDSADKRLQVLSTLDTLGAGFTIASHDMDIRGAGNLLGDQQSGHVKEVGVELYQKMLEEAVAEARAGGGEEFEDTEWSPTINLGATVMIPESYVPDLTQRMALYRRLADLDSREDIDAYCAELIDRFGPLPNEVKQLAHIMIIKGHSKRAGIEKLEAGPKGVVISFRDDKFANPAGLIQFISGTGNTAKVRPDHKLVYYSKMDKIGLRLKTVSALTKKLSQIAVA
ncbi:transcription-repair coupling factor [Kordiimonas sp. SCSIO 12603]|uniref:transcription-repair coupling factor n=1 Tax=Kordiimonas sp. SCSIO 12603 TaxID=2829596 RepID=UPI002102C1CC|nr:transcription-repair coupling factor [Kordiimonas sp. SCSIO 12603]UTW57753.1 transcription-repair coupling factor [Kordiimonas sp. SCSIO 12603]